LNFKDLIVPNLKDLMLLTTICYVNDMIVKIMILDLCCNL